MKSGIKTSELWVTLSAIAGSIGTVLYAFAKENCNFTPDKVITLVLGIVGSITAAGIYTKARTDLKLKKK